MRPIKKVLQNIFNFFGFRVSLIDRRQVPDVNRLKWLKDLNIQTVIDIGANKGNSVREFRDLFPSAMLYAFEPLPDCFSIMQAKVKGYNNIHLFNIALSDQKGSMDIHRSSYSGSSSLLKMADLHKKLFPVTAGERLISVVTDTLDTILRLETLTTPVLMKIDVQGFEDKVLAGGTAILQQVKIIIIDTSFKELYISQPLFGDIYALLTKQGFVYRGAWDPDFKSPEDGASVQQDAVFIRP